MTDVLTDQDQSLKYQYSYTRLKCYAECPLSFKLTYLDKKLQASAIMKDAGAAAHDFFRAWQLDPSDYRQKLTDAWACETRNDRAWDEYEIICQEFADKYKSPEFNLGGESSCEIKLAFDKDWREVEWFDNRAFFRGVIDRLDVKDDYAEITDWKSGYAGKASMKQCETYAFLVWKIRPEIKKFKVRIVYTRSWWKDEYMVRSEDLDVVDFQLKSQIRRIEQDNRFKATPGLRCLYCDVALACKGRPRLEGQLKTGKNAQRLAQEIFKLRGQLRAREDNLRLWCQTHGDVKLPGAVFGHFAKDRYHVEAAPMIQVLEQNEIDPFKYLRADTTKIKQLCRQNEVVADELAPFITVNTTLEFSMRKQGSADDK